MVGGGVAVGATVAALLGGGYEKIDDLLHPHRRTFRTAVETAAR